MSDLPKRAPRLRPELDDLGAFEPVDLPEALTRWMAWARAATRDQAMTADDVTPLIVRVHALLPLLKGPLGAAGDLWTVWRLINLPIDYNPPRRTRWLVLARAALQLGRRAAGAAGDGAGADAGQGHRRGLRAGRRRGPRRPDPAALVPRRRRADQRGRRARGGRVRHPDHRAAARRDHPVGLRDAARSAAPRSRRGSAPAATARRGPPSGSAPTTCTATATPARSTASTSDPRPAAARPRRAGDWRPARPEDRHRARRRRTTRPALPPPLIRPPGSSSGRRAEAIGP